RLTAAHPVTSPPATAASPVPTGAAAGRPVALAPLRTTGRTTAAERTLSPATQRLSQRIQGLTDRATPVHTGAAPPLAGTPVSATGRVTAGRTGPLAPLRTTRRTTAAERTLPTATQRPTQRIQGLTDRATPIRTGATLTGTPLPATGRTVPLAALRTTGRVTAAGRTVPLTTGCLAERLDRLTDGPTAIRTGAVPALAGTPVLAAGVPIRRGLPAGG